MSEAAGKIVSNILSAPALVVVFPFILFGEILRIISFTAFMVWRSRRANAIYMRHGWAARQAFLKSTPANYIQYSTAVLNV